MRENASLVFFTFRLYVHHENWQLKTVESSIFKYHESRFCGKKTAAWFPFVSHNSSKKLSRALNSKKKFSNAKPQNIMSK